jgi:hypothetical protein
MSETERVAGEGGGRVEQYDIIKPHSTYTYMSGWHLCIIFTILQHKKFGNDRMSGGGEGGGDETGMWMSMIMMLGVHLGDHDFVIFRTDDQQYYQ